MDVLRVAHCLSSVTRFTQPGRAGSAAAGLQSRSTDSGTSWPGEPISGHLDARRPGWGSIGYRTRGGAVDAEGWPNLTNDLTKPRRVTSRGNA